MAVFLAVTLVPSVLLVVLGWVLYRQDRASEAQQLDRRRAQAAAFVVEAMRQQLDDTVAALAREDLRATLATGLDGAVVVFSESSTETAPGSGLPYLPMPRVMPEAAPEIFVDAEQVEVQDPAAAIRVFRALATAADPATRAGALLGLARVLRRTGAVDRALGAYDDVTRIRDVSAAGMPADLFAAWARCDLLASEGRRDALRAEAATLLADLEGGRWPVTRAVYEANAADARAWLGDDEPIGSDVSRAPRGRLAAAVAMLWDRWRIGAVGAGATSGRLAIDVNGTPMTVVWTGTADALTALVAAPEYVESHWAARVRRALALQNVTLFVDRSPAEAGDGQLIRRSAEETGLPWALTLAHDDFEADRRQLATRRNLWLTGLGLLAALLGAGTAITARAMNRELAAARLQSAFVAAVSHEFRTPLTTLRQLTEILGDDRVASAEKRRSYYQALARQTDRLQRLVESLLDFGRMEAGARPYTLATHDGTAFVRGIVDAFRADPAASRHEVRFEGHDAAPVRVDPDALGLALWNLLDNAVKYSPDDPAIDVRVRRQSGDVTIAIQDRGIGIPVSERATIFERFRRGEGALARQIRGTGLGLAMVDHIVRAHGGRIDLESEPGAGTTFVVRLPVAEEATA